MLRPRGVEARIFSTHAATWRQLWRAVRGVDLVHLNSNHLRLVVFARLQRKPVLIKYHYPFWDEMTVGPHEPVGLTTRFWRDSIFIWRHTAPDGLGWARWRHNAARFCRSVLRIVVARAVDARLACSEFIARTTDLPLTVEVDYNPAPFPEDVPARETARVPIFLFAGRLDAAKGVDVLIAAAAKLARQDRQFRIVIVGDGGERENLVAFARHLGVAGLVDFVGRLSPARTLEHIARSTAVVVPSRVNESAPYVIVEAASVGRCCIGARRGGVPELAGTAGLLFVSGDADDLASQMDRLLTALDEAGTRGVAAFHYLRDKCGEVAASQRLLGAYRRLLADTVGHGRVRSE